MVRYERRGKAAWLTLDDPDRRNPMSTEVMRGLRDGVRTAQADPDVRVIVFTGAGDRAFSAGGDLSGGFVETGMSGHRDRGMLADLFRHMWHGGKPTVARVNGHALAGGFGLAVACDITICVDDAKLGVPEIEVGLWPMMITAALLRAMSQKAALELMMTGRTISPAEAHALGAISRVVERGDLDAAVDETVELLASKSPQALLLGREAFLATADLPASVALDRLQGGLSAVALSGDAMEGIMAFMEKRPPNWSSS